MTPQRKGSQMDLFKKKRSKPKKLESGRILTSRLTGKPCPQSQTPPWEEEK